MAQRRMFSKIITNSSKFLMMPQSTQNLYFHLGMNADDDGFCEHFVVMRMTESKPDDLKILHAKELVHIFNDKVLIVSDWKENNYIRSDRYTPSRYLEEYKEELKKLSDKSGIPNVIPDVIPRLGEVRLGEVRKNPPGQEDLQKQIGPLMGKFKPVNPSYKRLFANKTQRAALQRLIDEVGADKLGRIIDHLPKTNTRPYAPTITTPLQLEAKIGQLMAFVEKEKQSKDNITIV